MQISTTTEKPQLFKMKMILETTIWKGDEGNTTKELIEADKTPEGFMYRNLKFKKHPTENGSQYKHYYSKTMRLLPVRRYEYI